MRFLRWLGLAALALTVGGTAQAANIKIGVVLPFSGPNADLGHQIDQAFDLYIKLHAKDIAPHKVEIIKRDEGPPNGQVAKTATTELITNDKVPAKVVEKIIATLIANKKDLVAVQPALRELSAQNMYKDYGLPYAKGALAYYKAHHVEAKAAK